MRRFLCSAAVFGWPLSGLAHPHIFVETGLRVLVDESGQLEAVEVTWTYDEFYSLLVLEDRELDPDYNGELTEAELADLHGFDMNWVEGYAGDLYAAREGVSLHLGKPESLDTSVENGQIVTRHRRGLSGPADGVQLRAYDPTYYTAYDLGGGVTATGDCSAVVEPADRTEAIEKVAAIIRDMNDDLVEVEFPEVGAHFADTIRISCGD